MAESRLSRQLQQATGRAARLGRTMLRAARAAGLISSRGAGLLSGRGEGVVSAREAADAIGREVDLSLRSRGTGT